MGSGRSALRALLAAQGVGALGLAAGGTAGSLIAEDILGSTAYAALPLGLLVLGAAVSAPLLTALMRRRGRTAGLAVGYALATAGAALVVLAAALTDPATLLVGSVLLGIGNNAVMLGRYVAADLAPAGHSARAMSAALTAVTAGAVGGPALLGPAGSVARSLELPAAAGLYLLAAVAFPAAAALTLRLQLRLRHTVGVRGTAVLAASDDPQPGGAGTRDRPKADNSAAGHRLTGHRLTGRRLTGGAALALIVLGVSNLTMVTAMGVAPARLHAHHWSLDTVGLLVAGHVVLMFGPSALSGWFCDRAGPRRTALLGGLVQLLALPLIAPAGTGGSLAAVPGLLLLGLGWNLQLVSGSALVIRTAAPAHRHRAEGLGESAMGAGAVVGTLGMAGPLLAAGGLPLLCLALGAFTLLASIPLLREYH
ncbi:MFS transporter [Streptomyces sp. NPDC018833]|uniref:MFS transporter n=1 Tax=Streptomyces sp. NPDC018833 TaxID=3365053 RepID=UPI0037AA6B37